MHCSGLVVRRHEERKKPPTCVTTAEVEDGIAGQCRQPDER